MNWYNHLTKTSSSELDERNRLNLRISEFREIAISLQYMVKYVVQNPPHVKKALESISNSKILSSYPKLKESLVEASRRALDNYRATATLCNDVSEQLYVKIQELEKQRSDILTKLHDRIQNKLKRKTEWTAK